uniref:TRPM SLOG domain-containing protein n=1 Tax=Poecilia reticulata TaxID=8081 RepID=A0A3P9PMV4_POERE
AVNTSIFNKFAHKKKKNTKTFPHCLSGVFYVRVSADTEATVLYQLLTEQWGLSPPNLLISVTGGANNFYLKSHLKKVFYRGLMKIAQTTGAWIITGGTNVGVMRHVGQAVKDFALSNTKQKEIAAIGVAPWGAIHNREKLVNEEVS